MFLKTAVILLLAIGSLFGAYFILNKVLVAFQPDRFADNLVIPDNIEIHSPKDDRFSDGYLSANNPNLKTPPNFEIYHTELPGIYKFVFWTEKMEEGTVYLKAYEITGEYSLSAYDLRKNSSINISNVDKEFKKFGPTSFIIHEGDWEKFYAARFEVWFAPFDTSKGERKLIEKIYKIEGYSN